MMKNLVLALFLFGIGEAFIPGVQRNRAIQVVLQSENNAQSSKSAAPPKPEMLSEISDPTLQEPAWIKHQAEANYKGTKQEGYQGVSATDYQDLIDGDTFDGGDGQVGVVGDKGNKMPSFKERGTVETTNSRSKLAGESVGGSESKKRQKVAFGYSTGYAEKLKEEGMSDIDEYGEDRLAARRQQLENWANQQAHKARQTEAREEFASVTGTVYDPRRGSATYMEALSETYNDDDKFTMIMGDKKEKKSKTDLAAGLKKGPITQVIEMSCMFPRPSFHTIQVKNDVLTYEAFQVGFGEGTTDDGSDFQVTPTSGELNRRGGEPVPLQVVFKPSAPGGVREAFIVVQTDESKWTYHVIGTVK